MTVVTAARPTTPLAHYNRLAPIQQHGFDNAIAHAHDARDADRYNEAMRYAALAAGIALPDGGEIAKCACPTCYCDAIFDTFGPGLIVIETTDYGVQQIQCATCADDHPVTPED